MIRLALTVFLLISHLIPTLLAELRGESAPNVVLVLTDDQGIGDLGSHGNPWLKTPNIDAFYRESLRFTDFHVSPLCTPTRAAIMTGLYPINNGAWATFKGRDALPEGSTTLADVFKNNGYRTGLFGKWHLGDNYPARPTDCGFDVAIQHQAGGVGELSDYWGNSYFDDVYYVNNEPRQFSGYCADVWFDEAMKFMEENKDEPFFVYLSTNTPHDPLIVAEEFSAPYEHLQGDKIISADLYGMIANIDENFGKLRQFLEEEELAANTILIFMTDNGTRFGYSHDGKLGYNAGYSGIKGDKREGGHRVPFFIQWPNGDVQGGIDIEDLATHVDLIPTLAGLCELSLPSEMPLDGVDLSPYIQGEKQKWPKRSVFVHHRQDWRPPKELEGSCIMNGDWRLLNGNELYDIRQDPKQQNNLAAQYPELVAQLKSENKSFVETAKAKFEYKELPASIVGSEAQGEIKLTIQHAIGEDVGIWKPEQVAAGIKNRNNTHALKFVEAGDYIIACRRWPKECPGPILGIPQKNPKGLYDYQLISPSKVRIQIADRVLEKEIGADDEEVVFQVRLEKGRTVLVTDFIEGESRFGVYYTYIRKLESL